VRRAPRLNELLLLAAALGLCAASAHFLPGRRGTAGLTYPGPAADFFPETFDANTLPEFDLAIGPEFLRALNAAVPDPAVSWTSRDIRLKKVPLAKLVIDGRRMAGPHTLRYRGFSHYHWGYRQKSMKIQAKRGKMSGYAVVNLNALNSDAFFFDLWASRLLRNTGGVTSRIGLARLSINGRYDGLREIVENLDMDLLARQGLPKGAIYRERLNIDFSSPLRDPAQLRELWKKNSMQNSDWWDIELFHRSIQRSASEDRGSFREFVNIPHYINYSAVSTIIGTRNLNNHNIPVYRPRSDSRFIPIGYDFSSPAQASLSDRFPAVQTPYVAQNWLSQLFWSDPQLRGRIHKRTADILSRFPDLFERYENLLRAAAPELERGIDQGLVLDRPSLSVASLADYREKNRVRGWIKNRLEYLRRSYLDPVARITPGWRKKGAFQLVIEGAGRYAVELDGADEACARSPIRLRAHEGPWRDAWTCGEEGAVPSPVPVERNDIVPPASGTASFVKRNSIGAILVDFENPGRGPLSGIRVRSLQTGQDIPVREDWPFDIRRMRPGRVSLGAPKLPYRRELGSQDGYSLIRLPNQTPYSFTFAGAMLEIEGAISDPERPDDRGPLLCWTLGGRGFCFEFTPRFGPAARSPGPAPPRPADPVRTLDPAALTYCSSYTFTRGDWSIPHTAAGSRRCRVRFEAGARLLFGPGVHMALSGPVEFPVSGEPVVFTAAEKSWGGLILDAHGSDCLIRNARFSRAAEFRRKNRRYTGALTVLSPGLCRIEDSVFSDNSGDDALHAVGGRTEVRRSLFLRNRDAMDFDDGEALVEDSMVSGTVDDAVDCGNADVVIRNTVLRGSGDKGVSVGEGSTTRVEDTLITDGNIGVGVKDRSRAVLQRTLLRGNGLALAVYRDPDAPAGGRAGVLEGSPSLEDNNEALKIDGRTLAPASAGLKPPDAGPGLAGRIEARLQKRCPLCRSGKRP